MSSLKAGKVQRRYSTAFQLKVVREIEQGKYSAAQARRLYDIGGKSTIAKWLRAHGRSHLLSEVVQVRMKTEQDKIKQLEQRIRDLESALADAQVEKYALQGLVQVMDEKTGGSVKKKVEQMPLTERERLLGLLKPPGRSGRGR
jgi:transposase-like protein